MRIYTSQSAPLDFCDECTPSEELALKIYGDIGDGPDGRGNCFCYDSDHPDYNFEDIKCETCRRRLVDLSTSSWIARPTIPPGCAQATY